MEEKVLIERICKILRQNNYEPQKEFSFKVSPSFRIRSDIVFKHPKRGLIAIECKMSDQDSFRGFGQALSYLLFANEVWLGVSKKSKDRLSRLIANLEKRGISLPVSIITSRSKNESSWEELVKHNIKVSLGEPRQIIHLRIDRYLCFFCSNVFLEKEACLYHLLSIHGFDPREYEADRKELQERRLREATIRQYLRE